MKKEKADYFESRFITYDARRGSATRYKFLGVALSVNRDREKSGLVGSRALGKNPEKSFTPRLLYFLLRLPSAAAARFQRPATNERIWSESDCGRMRKNEKKGRGRGGKSEVSLGGLSYGGGSYLVRY